MVPNDSTNIASDLFSDCENSTTSHHTSDDINLGDEHLGDNDNYDPDDTNNVPDLSTRSDLFEDDDDPLEDIFDMFLMMTMIGILTHVSFNAMEQDSYLM